MSIRQAALVSEQLKQEIGSDPFDTALAELRRIDRECREQHARFMAASRHAREAFDTAIAGLGVSS